jgi:lipoprotein-releasing system permease protein
MNSGTELDESLALVHLDVLEPFLSGSSARQGVAVQLHDVFSASRWRWELIQMVPSDLRVTDWRMTHGNLYTAIQLSRDLIGLILFIVIFVAAFNVVSSLMLVVTDRRKAIAMLMALGGRGSDITAIFFLQGGLIGVVGAVFGTVLGFGLAVAAPDLAVMLERWLEAPLLQTDVYPLAFVPVDIRWQDFATTGAMAIGCRDSNALTALFLARLPLAADRVSPHRINEPVAQHCADQAHDLRPHQQWYPDFVEALCEPRPRGFKFDIERLGAQDPCPQLVGGEIDRGHGEWIGDENQ